MMLTTLESLKTRLGLEQHDLTEDTMLTGFVEHCSGRFEQECNRKFARVAGDTYEFCADAREIIVPRYPVEAVTAWHLKSTEAEGWVAQSGVECLMRSGCVVSLEFALGSDGEQGRITYTAGYVLPDETPGAGQVALPEELEQCCIEQVAYWYQNRNRLGLVSVSGQGGSVVQQPQSVVKPLDLLPQVMAVLRRYERYTL